MIGIKEPVTPKRETSQGELRCLVSETESCNFTRKIGSEKGKTDPSDWNMTNYFQTKTPLILI